MFAVYQHSAICLSLATLGGCQGVAWAPTLPGRNTVVLDQLVVYTDFRLPKQHRLLEDLTALRADLSTRLGLPVSDEPIHVYLFETAEQLRTFIDRHYPTFPSRRALFVETDTRLAVYAYWGDRVAEDLRHETAHGYLHALVPNLPLWLDEGLAEYFEVPRGNHGLNRPNVQELTDSLAQGWRPDLYRLEQLHSAAAMTQIDYAEAWAWVHYFLETTPEHQQFLRDYLQRLGQSESAEPLSNSLRRMHMDYERRLLNHAALLGQSLR
jgi:hypothetical protein